MRPRSTPLSAAAVRPPRGMRHRRPQYRRGAAVCVQGPSFHPLFVARRGANRTVALSASTVSLSLFGKARSRILLAPGLRSTVYRVLQRRVNTIEEFLVGKRFDQIANGPSVQRLGSRATVIECGDEDDRNREARCDQTLLQFEPVHARHLYVQ